MTSRLAGFTKSEQTALRYAFTSPHGAMDAKVNRSGGAYRRVVERMAADGLLTPKPPFLLTLAGHRAHVLLRKAMWGKSGCAAYQQHLAEAEAALAQAEEADRSNALIHFPTYPAADLPPLPHGWVDLSWRNDLCPCYAPSVDSELRLWLDFPNPADREFPEAARFSLHDGEAVLWQGDDWADALRRAYAATISEPVFERLRMGQTTKADAALLLAAEEAAERPCPDLIAAMRALLAGKA